MRRPRRAKLQLLGMLVVAVSMASLTGCARKPPRRARPGIPPSVHVGEPETGLASWYGDPYHGRATANGEIYDKRKFTAAHRTLPFNTWVRVNNLENNRFSTVRINDRGPFLEGRIIDLSEIAAEALAMIGAGTVLVRLDIIQKPEGEPNPHARFVVQVGAFRVRENAEQLRERLAKEFRGVFIDTHDAPDGRYFRVRVSAPGEEAAFRLAARLRRQADVGEPFVVRLD